MNFHFYWVCVMKLVWVSIKIPSLLQFQVNRMLITMTEGQNWNTRHSYV